MLFNENLIAFPAFRYELMGEYGTIFDTSKKYFMERYLKMIFVMNNAKGCQVDGIFLP